MGLELLASNYEKIAETIKTSKSFNFEKTFQNANVDNVERRHIPTINEGMEGKSVNGVKFEKRTFILNEEKVEGVFPVFKSHFDCRLPENMYRSSDSEQMKYCVKNLAERIERDPDFGKNFTARQLEQIRNGEPRINGLTWHHNEIPGKMQLVNSVDHNAARHTGGRSIWGGGSDSR